MAAATITNLDRNGRGSRESAERLPRKLAAILHADVAGYSRLSGEDEEGTHRSLRACFDLIASSIDAHNGRVVNYAGDAVLADFGTVVDALGCAAAIQLQLKKGREPGAEPMQFRMGVNLGDVIVDQQDIYGDGVNVAARLSSLAEPGGICIAESVRSAVGRKLPLRYEYIGEQRVKNILEPVRTYRVILEPAAQRLAPRINRIRRPVVVLALTLALAAIGALALWRGYPQAPGPPAVMTRAEAASNSIAVLPFANISDDARQEYFADGITEDLITGLTKISSLLVIARDSSFLYKNESLDIRQVARRLNVRYILEGSVRREAKRVRINAQLIDAGSGTNLWAERYEGEIGSVFALQDQITEKIVAALAIKLTTGEREHLARQETESADAHQYFLQGQAFYHRHSRSDNEEARRLYQKAIDIDPKFARVYAMYALTYWFEFANGWTGEPDRALERAWTLAEQAVALHSALPEAHFVRGLVHRERREYVKALVDAERAIAIDPNYANGRVLLASVLYYAGRAEEGLLRMEEAIRLNPHHPHNYSFHLGQAYFILGRYDEAIDIFRKGLASNPTSHRLRLWLAAAYAQAGQMKEAQWELDLILIKNPDFSLKRIQQAYPFKYSADLSVFLDGLRKAGLPD